MGLARGGTPRLARGAKYDFSVDDLASRLASLRDGLGRSVAVAIDGASGAGKSTLAFDLVSRLHSAFVLQSDSYHVPLACAYRMIPENGEIGAMIDWRRLRETALCNVKKNEAFRIEWINLFTERLEAVHEIPPNTIVLCDGTFSARDELWDYYDYRILVDCEAGEAKRRREHRDAGRGDAWRHYINAIWLPDEEAHLAKLQPARFDVVIDGGAGALAS